jgi:hypothetical protein
MSRDRRLEQLFCFGEALNVVYIGVGGDECLAVGEGEVEHPNRLHDFVDDFFVANVDQNPLVLVIDEVDIATENSPQLVVDFDDVWENRFALKHGQTAVAGIESD